MCSWFEVEDLAKRIREKCIEAVVQAYQDAGMQGLCAEWRWEAAVGALTTVDLGPLLREIDQSSASKIPPPSPMAEGG